MNFHDTLANAIDTLVTQGNEAAEKALEPYFSEIKKQLNAKPKKEKSVELLNWWGQGLEIIDEHEQALLKYQRIIEVDWGNREVLFRMVNLFMYSMHKPEHAVPILEEKLLEWDPENQEYQDALDAAKSSFDPSETKVINLNTGER